MFCSWLLIILPLNYKLMKLGRNLGLGVWAKLTKSQIPHACKKIPSNNSIDQQTWVPAA